MIINCIYCKKDFEAKSRKAKYCSTSCCNKNNYYNVNNHQHTCLACGTTFSSGRADMHYCSKVCAGLAKPSLTMQDLDAFIRANKQVPMSNVKTHFKTSNRKLYALLKQNGFNSYKDYVAYSKGIYDEKSRADTSTACVTCLNVLSDLLGITHATEATFDECVNPKTGKQLRFDGYFPSLNLLVEYNGIQHYKHIPWFHKGNNSLEYQQYKDSIKLEYCKSKGIRLLVVKYDTVLTEKNLKAILDSEPISTQN